MKTIVTAVVVVAASVPSRLDLDRDTLAKLLAELRVDTYITRKLRDRLNRLDDRLALAAAGKKRKPVQRRD